MKQLAAKVAQLERELADARAQIALLNARPQYWPPVQLPLHPQSDPFRPPWLVTCEVAPMTGCA